MRKSDLPKPAGQSFSLPKLEEEILAFWEKGNFFKRSIAERPAEKSYVFYDGPPYATGLPHYGHLLASTIKDTVPRYMTMKGFRVERRFGWDCHGLPVEVEVEKELGLKSRKDIEAMGVDKFNAVCRTTVLRYVQEWRRTITRLGRWVDFDNDYKTMDVNYMESCLWVFGELYKKGLVYQDYRTSLFCTRCETPLSKMETAMDNSYKEVEDPSVYVAFETADDSNTFFLAWTTTPWTLPGNVALAVKDDEEYVKVQLKEVPSNLDDNKTTWLARKLIMAKPRLTEILEAGSYDILTTMTGAELVGQKYKPLLEYIKPEGDAYKIVAADFVSMDDGTGLVHIAPAFGEEDFELSKSYKLPILLTITDAGTFLPQITPWAGQHVKAADPSIMAALERAGQLFKSGTITHSYPFCWRCNNPLIYKVQKSWYLRISDLKQRMLETNADIHWVPDYLKNGRFGQGVESAPDWGVSRSRYWGVPIPIWRCNRCEQEKVLSSLQEIEQAVGQRPTDLHRPMIDQVAWACSCGGTFTRISDVFDVWFDSGCMPYAQVHYPFENKAEFEATFPADFITEYIGQTRGWFYYLHALSNGLFGQAAFKNVVNTGIILAEDGTKMSKSKKNFPDPQVLFDKHGSDAMRLYLVASPVMQADNLSFSEQGVDETVKKVLLLFWNVLSFFLLYAPVGQKVKAVSKPVNILDCWILAKLEATRQTIDEDMGKYELAQAARAIAPFINDLSTWYVRRSRDRFKGENATDKEEALATLFTVLLETSKMTAPFIPFLSEAIYQKLKPWNEKTADSVHLETWSDARPDWLDPKLIEDVEIARRVIELGHALRAQEKIKVRQPLRRVWVKGLEVPTSVLNIILDELNVREWAGDKVSPSEGTKGLSDAAGVELILDTVIDEELQLEGLKRELVRLINAERKKAGLTIADKVKISYKTESALLSAMIAKYVEQICRETMADKIIMGKGKLSLLVNNEEIFLTISKV